MTGERETTGRNQAGGRWTKGKSGNPNGRPRGSRHAALVALDAIGAEAAEAIMRAVVEAAQGGDMRAADLLLRRLWPERRGRPVTLDLPSMTTAADLVAALGAVAGAVSAGELSPEEGQAVAAIMEAHRKAIETADLERRVAGLESRAGQPG